MVVVLAQKLTGLKKNGIFGQNKNEYVQIIAVGVGSFYKYRKQMYYCVLVYKNICILSL